MPAMPDPLWDASLNQLVGICTQKKISSLFLAGDHVEDIEILNI